MVFKLNKPDDLYIPDYIAISFKYIIALYSHFRPPGHHAEHDFSMGYCYFNNVAIAAKIAQKKWNVKRQV